MKDFLIGDIVVKEFTDDISLYEVRGLCNQAVLIDKPCCAAMYVHRSGLRAATVAEVKANKRLPEPVVFSDVVVLKDVQDDNFLFEVAQLDYEDADSCLLLQKVTAESRPVYYEQIRHATSAEKVAGHRLKYDWSKVPIHVQWIATDDDGLTFGYPNKPFIELYFGRMCWNNEKYVPYFIGNIGYKGDWKDSLEQRPNQCNFTKLESMGDDEDILNHISHHCIVDGKSGVHHD